MTETKEVTFRTRLRNFWNHTFIFNIVMFTVAIILSLWMIDSAFSEQFQCDYLIVDRVAAPEFMCTGADLSEAPGVGSVVDEVSDFLGLGDDSESDSGSVLSIPGLANLINGPLNVIRRIGIVAGLVLLAAISTWITWIISQLHHIRRLLSFDKEAWRQTARAARLFITVFVVLLVPIWLLLVVF